MHGGSLLLQLTVGVFLFFRMKCVVILLVLSLLVFMAEPGECFFRIFKGVKRMIKGAVKGWKGKSRHFRH